MKSNLKTLKNLGVFLRWLPLTGSLTLMIMVSVVAAFSFSRLKNSSFWREHTYEVLARAQVLLSDLFNIQGEVRDYVFTSQPAALRAFQEAVHSAPLQLTQLKLLTHDNLGQQERLRRLGPDLDEVIAYSQQLVDTRNAHGLQAAVQVESNGLRMGSMNRTHADLQAFMDAEGRLLSQRSAEAEVDFHNTEHLLASGSILAALLLVVANLMTNRAMARQRELTYAQSQLTHAAQAAERAKSEFLQL